MVSAELPDNWQDLIAGYVLGNLDDEEAAIVDRLLSTHPELMQEVEAFQTAFHSLAEVAPTDQPPARLRAKLFSEIQPEPVRAKIPANRRLSWIAGMGGAIAAVTLVALGLRIASLNSQLQQANAKIDALQQDLKQARPILNTLQQPGTLTFSLQGSDRANAASGSLVMSAEKDKVIILVQNLPELPSGQIYRLWAKVPKASTLAYCGQFNTNAQGFVQLTPSDQICGANPTQMFITIDALSDPTTKGGRVIMQTRT